MTNSKPKLRAIKCTQCGGSVELNGGHKVRSIVCQYCGSCMDTKDSFKVLHQFLNQKRPYSPLKIGKSGKLKGIKFTVIGVIQYEERDYGEVFRWLEYLLFSPTHGYVWLCFEDGHWCMVHEVKDLPEGEVSLSLPRKSSFTVRDKKFQVFESSGAQISYVEGELTWRAKQKERVRYMDAVCPPYIYSIENRGGIEQEYFWGEYIEPEEISEAFKIETFDPTGVFACQPFKANPVWAGISKGALLAAIVTLIAYFFISSNGRLIFQQQFDGKIFSDTQISKIFKAKDPSTCYGITLSAPHLNNKWAWYGVKVVDKDMKNSYFTLPANISYYSGYEGGEYWTEGSTEVTAYFKVPDKGEFKLAVDGEGGTGEIPDTRFNPGNTIVQIRDKVRQGHYTLAWFIFSLLISAPFFIRKWMFEAERWNDGDDEDDD